MVEHVLEAVAGHFAEVLIVGGLQLPPALVARYGARAVPDVLTERSSLNGVLSAIEGSSSNWTAILACDAPWPCVPLLERMARLGGNRIHVVACENETGEIEPLHALWHRSVAAEVKNAVEAGELALRDLLQQVRIQRVLPKTWREYDPHGRFLQNLNTPDQVLAAEGRNQAGTNPSACATAQYHLRKLSSEQADGTDEPNALRSSETS
jgi:molybdopterin-guanine dinucleotide biosynthesis protein A